MSLFCYALLCAHSSFTIILNRKRKLVDFLLLSYRCIVTINVLKFFQMVPWVDLQCVIVVFPGHTYLVVKVYHFALKILSGNEIMTYGMAERQNDGMTDGMTDNPNPI